VVWQGSAGDRRPYAYQTAIWEVTPVPGMSASRPQDYFPERIMKARRL